MADEVTKEELQQRITELEKELEESKNNPESFDELKEKYEKIIQDKDKEIQELNETVTTTKKKVDDTVDDLNDEVQARLEATEEYKKLISTVQQLEQEKAEASVDAVIQKGLALPAQKDVLKKWCLNDSESFTEYFDNAQPIVDVNRTKSKRVTSDLNRIVDYFKN